MKRTLRNLASRGIETRSWEGTLLFEDSAKTLHSIPYCFSVSASTHPLPKAPATADTQLCWCWNPSNKDLHDDISTLLDIETLLEEAARHDIEAGMMYRTLQRVRTRTAETATWSRNLHERITEHLKRGAKTPERIEALLALSLRNGERLLSRTPEADRKTVLAMWDPEWEEMMLLWGTRIDAERIQQLTRLYIGTEPWQKISEAAVPGKPPQDVLETALSLWNDGAELPRALTAAEELLR